MRLEPKRCRGDCVFTSASLRIWNRPLVSTVTLLETRLPNQSDRGAICQRARLCVGDDGSSHLCQRSHFCLLCVSQQKKEGSEGQCSHAYFECKHEMGKEGRHLSVELASLAHLSSFYFLFSQVIRDRQTDRRLRSRHDLGR